MLRRLMIALMLAVSPALAGGGGPPASPVATTIYVNDQSPGATIPANFVGLDINVCGDFIPGCAGYAGGTFLVPTNTALINAFKLIASSGTLSIGGNTADTVPVPQATQAQCNNLGSFLTAAGLKLNYVLDAVANAPTTAASQAACIATGVGTSNVVFQIGNEPDLQSAFQPWNATSGQDGTGSGANTYYALWKTYCSGIAASVSGAKFYGPDVHNFFNTYWPAFITGISGGCTLSGLTLHQYPAGTSINGTANIPNMINTAVLTSSVNKAPPAAPAYSAAALTIAAGVGTGVPIVMAETNNIAIGGLNFASNGLCSATWAVDWGMQLAVNGWAGAYYTAGLLNFGNPYTPLIDTPSLKVFPEFYGLMILGAVEGGQILPATYPGIAPNGSINNPGINVMGYGVLGTDGKTRIIVLNRDLVRTATVSLTRQSAYTSASVSIITGNAPQDQTGVTYAGATVSSSGTFTPSPIAVPSGSTFSLTPCSAALAVLS